jgi:hypothetical protein
MSNLYRGPSIDASYQVSLHSAKRFQKRRFLEIDQSETRIACGGHVCYNNKILDMTDNIKLHEIKFHDDCCY